MRRQAKPCCLFFLNAKFREVQSSFWLDGQAWMCIAKLWLWGMTHSFWTADEWDTSSRSARLCLLASHSSGWQRSEGCPVQVRDIFLPLPWAQSLTLGSEQTRILLLGSFPFWRCRRLHRVWTVVPTTSSEKKFSEEWKSRTACLVKQNSPRQWVQVLHCCSSTLVSCNKVLWHVWTCLPDSPQGYIVVFLWLACTSFCGQYRQNSSGFGFLYHPPTLKISSPLCTVWSHHNQWGVNSHFHTMKIADHGLQHIVSTLLLPI